MSYDSVIAFHEFVASEPCLNLGQRFDFSKRVHCCGITLDSAVIPGFRHCSTSRCIGNDHIRHTILSVRGSLLCLVTQTEDNTCHVFIL